MESVKNRVSEEEWALRVELAAAYRVFAMLGWTHLIHTHITVKTTEENQFLINPFGLLWEEINASSLVKVNAEGQILDQGSTEYGINPAGFKIHSATHTSERKATTPFLPHQPPFSPIRSGPKAASKPFRQKQIPCNNELRKGRRIEFVSDYSKYQLARVGASGLYDVPKNKRGHLSCFRGKTIRLVCIGSGPHFVREYIDKPYNIS